MHLLNNIFKSLLAVILTLIIFFPPLALGGRDLASIVILELLILSGFFIYLLRSAGSGVIEYRKNILNALFAIFIFSVLSQIFFKTAKLPYETFFALKLVVLYFALFTLIVNNVQNKKDIDSLIFRIMLVGLFISVLGILQKATGSAKMYWTINPRNYIFFSTFKYKNHFACYISVVALLTLGSFSAGFASRKETSRGPGIKALFMFFSFAVMTIAIFLSNSRSGTLFFAVSAAFFASCVFLSHKNAKRTILLLCLALIAVYLSLELVAALAGIDMGIGEALKKFSSVFSPERFATRLSLYKDGSKIFLDYPFFGIGLGCLYNVIPSYLSHIPYHGWGFTEGILGVAVISRDVSNDPLQLLIEMGFFGFVLISMPFLIFLKRVIGNVRKSSHKYGYLVGLSALSSFLFLGLCTMADHVMAVSAIASFFTMLLAISILVVRLEAGGGDSPEVRMETKKIITLKSVKNKIIFFILSGALFAYLAFMVSKPLIVDILTKDGRTHADFKRALALEPKNARAHRRYHNFLLLRPKDGPMEREDDYAKAELAIDKAMKLNPYDKAYPLAKANFEILRSNYEKASLIYENIVRREPNNPVLYMDCALMIFRQALSENDAKRKHMLLKKGMRYYSEARALSRKKLFLHSFVKDGNAYRFLIEGLRKEGLDVR